VDPWILEGTSQGSPAGLSISTSCPMYRYWANNVRIQPKLLHLGLLDSNSSLPAGFQVAHTLSNLLLQPSELLRAILLQTFEPWDRERFSIVGVEIRTQRSEQRAELNTSTGLARHFFACAQQVAKSLGGDAKVKYYISTDTQALHEQAVSIFGRDSVIQIPGSYLPADKRAMYKSAIDSIYMGMYADALVITPGSRAGMLAAIAAGKNPYHVELHDGPTQFQCKKTDLQNIPSTGQARKTVQMDSPLASVSPFLGASSKTFVGRFSPSWPGPNERLRERWIASQHIGNQTRRFVMSQTMSLAADTYIHIYIHTCTHNSYAMSETCLLLQIHTYICVHIYMYT
jgi:hypothetical protein